jgi:hypothetical protein|tara:strand:+ start:410 stop:1030 length:621 start_codon:yes stop_codon:yes gene_type:complete
MAGADDAQLKDFQGLPIQSLIIDPLVASAKGQRDLAMVTLDFINEFGFEEDKDTKQLKARTVDVEIERLIEGKSAPLKQTLKMPLISMVTIPNLSIQDVEIDFTMEVKSHTEKHSESGDKQVDGTTSSVSGGASGSFWGVSFHADASHGHTHTGTVTSKSSNTRTTDFSAKYDIKVSAQQNPPAEGMSRFTQMLASAMEPVDTQAK